MPFVAHDAELGAIAPAQADHRTEYDCLGCDDSVTLRRSHERGEAFVAAHFWHPSSRPDDCSAESDTHIRMKSIAASKAQARWPDATVRWEGVVGDRRADVLVEFSEQDDRLGDGVAIECQHKHEDKDTEAVTDDFRDAGLSVLWLYEEHYDGKDVDLDAGDWQVWWAGQVPGHACHYRGRGYVRNEAPPVLTHTINQDGEVIDIKGNKTPASYRARWFAEEIRDAVRKGRQERKRARYRDRDISFVSKKPKNNRKTKSTAGGVGMKQWYKRYEGWDEDTGEPSTVKVFCKKNYKWTEIKKERAPDVIREKHDGKHPT